MRKLFTILMISFFVLSIGACSKEYENDEHNNNYSPTGVVVNNVVQRKIIYTVESSFDVDNVNESITTLRGLIQEDEWFDLEIISGDNATFRARIKTNRLDVFLDMLHQHFQVRSFTKTGRDISLDYQDKTNRIAAIELQMGRLQELYQTASLSDLLIINQQLSSLEVELMRLNGELSVFDALIEYSEVTIRLYGQVVITKSPFFNRFANGFVDGVVAVGVVLDTLFIALATITPFVVVFGSIGVGGYILRKKYILPRKAKKKEANNSLENKSV